MHLVQELLETYSTVVVQEVLQRRQESWRWGAQRLGFGSEQRPNERVIEADPLTSTQEVAKELNVAILWLFCIWSKLGRWKSLISGCVMNWLQIKKKKIHRFEVSSFLILHNNNEPFLDHIVTWQKVDFMWQPVITKLLDQEEAPKHFLKPDARPRRSSKALLKAKLAPKKGHGHCFVVCCHSDPLQLSESQRNHYIWEVCSANR